MSNHDPQAQRRIDALEANFNKIKALWTRNNTALEKAKQNGDNFAAVVTALQDAGLVTTDPTDGSVCLSPKLLTLLSIDWSKVFTAAGGLRKSPDKATAQSLRSTSPGGSESTGAT